MLLVSFRRSNEFASTVSETTWFPCCSSCHLYTSSAVHSHASVAQFFPECSSQPRFPFSEELCPHSVTEYMKSHKGSSVKDLCRKYLFSIPSSLVCMWLIPAYTPQGPLPSSPRPQVSAFEPTPHHLYRHPL